MVVIDGLCIPLWIFITGMDESGQSALITAGCTSLPSFIDPKAQYMSYCPWRLL